MGITIVQKSDLTRVSSRSLKALILSGGAITGGSFKAGGLKALNDYLETSSVTDFDLFVGISSGSLIAACLAAGIPPESILRSLDGTSKHFSQLTAWHCYRPNIAEMIARPIRFLVQVAGALPAGLIKFAERGAKSGSRLMVPLTRFVLSPSIESYSALISEVSDFFARQGVPPLISMLPSGAFDNRPIETYVRENILRNELTNEFRTAYEVTGKRLYISAMRLHEARRVVFGPGEDESLTISEAIQASTALPGFYKPAHIHGVDYVDGGVQETANIDTAVELGSRLIVCYNPFRPCAPSAFVHGFERSRHRKHRSLAADGIMTVLNQILRTVFHERLHIAIERFRSDPAFKGDIVLIEPRADDEAFFALNPMSLRHRIRAAKLGYESVRNSIEERYEELSRLFAAYGMAFGRRRMEESWKVMTRPDASDEEIRRQLEKRKEPSAAEKRTPLAARTKKVPRSRLKIRRGRKGKKS